MLACLACTSQKQQTRRTVGDLYQEALQKSANRPATISAISVGTLGKVPTLGTTKIGTQCDELTTAEQRLLASDPSSIYMDGFKNGNSRKNQQTVPFRTTPWKARISDLTIPAGFEQLAEETAQLNEVFEQTDVREAVQILAAQAKVKVVIDDTVGGVTSAQIDGETFEKALERILLPVGLVYARDGDRYIVAPPDPDSPLYPLISTRTQFTPIYHNVSPLALMLPLRYKKFIQTSDERNIIVVDAPAVISSDILSRLRELDQPIPQVELEAIVCVVAPDSSFRFGIDWNHAIGTNGSDSLKIGMSGLSGNAAVSGANAQNAFKDFATTTAFVRLLAEEGYITIRAAPRVTAKDGEKATIAINRETFFSLQPANSNVFFRQDLQKVEAGISLEITPRVHNNLVAVAISKAEVSEDIRSTSTSTNENSANAFPVINRRLVSTEVMVPDGHTIVIGGLVQRQTVDRVRQVPFLGRIPIIGNLFKSVEKQDQEAEVAIFISPRIVPPDSLCISSVSH